MGVSLVVAEAGKESGTLLKEYLQARGVYDPNSKSIVSYGLYTTPHKDVRVLNSNAGRGKIRAMTLMKHHNVSTVPLWFAPELANMNPYQLEQLKYPMFARMSHGMGAKDIGLVLQPEEIPWRIAAGWEWFSTFIPTAAELRVWIYRERHLDTYEKQMMRPNEYKAMGRNFGQGFEFVHTDPYPAAVQEAIKAVKAVVLDFAAVDILVGKDGGVYVLEANTAPGVIRSGCQKTLGKLADCIAEWDRVKW